MIDCQQALALLQDILDKEASEIDEKEVRAHLEKCGECFEKFRLEESIHKFLNEKIKITSSSDSKPDKLESMRLNLMSQLDTIDSECEKSKKTPFGNPFKIFLSTAALVLLAFVWYNSAGFLNHSNFYVPLEQAHITASHNTSQYSHNTDYLGAIEQNLNYTINTSFADYSFVGGKNEKIMGVDVAHIVLSNDTDYISIFITPAKNIEIPDDLKSTMIKKGDFELFDHNCRGCRLIFHKMNNLMIITASTNKKIDLMKFDPGHLTI